MVALIGLSGCSFMAATTPNGSTQSCIPDRDPDVSGPFRRGPLMDIVVVGAAAATDIALYIRR